MTALTTLAATLGPGRGEYLLRDTDGRQHGSLQSGGALRRAQIQTTGGSWPTRRRGWREVTAGDSGRPLVRLAPRQAVVPGPGRDPHWTVRRHRGGHHAVIV
jgi:hypothetical protein